MKKRARLKDIATALNLSITTVSRALNNKEDISTATKQKVLEVADMMDYRPNYFAKYLTEDHNNILGIIVPRINHSYFSKMIEGIVTEAQEKGYFIIVGESLDDAENESCILDQFRDLKLEGILVAPVHRSIFSDPKSLKGLRSERIVIIDRFSNSDMFNQVTNDHYQGAITAMTHLQHQGYTRVAHIRGLVDDTIADAIYRGYQHFTKVERGRKEIVFTCSKVSPDQGYDATKYFMSLKSKPDAIFAISDEAAQGVYRYCYEHRINIPNDLGVIGYSNASFSQYLTPSLSTIEQHSLKMGKYAIELLTRPQPPVPTIKRVFQSTLISRESTNRSNNG